MLTLLSRLEAGLALLVRTAAVVSTAIVLVFTLGSAADRYIYDTPFNAHDQIAQLALVWTTFLGLVLAIRARTNIRVDLLDSMLSPGWIRVRDIAGDLVALAIFGVLQWKIWRLVEVGAGQIIMGTPFSSAATFMALAIGSAAAIAVLAIRMVLLSAGRGLREDDGPC